MRSWRFGRWWVLVLASSCSSLPTLPGAEVLGTFELHATEVSNDCRAPEDGGTGGLSDLPGREFDFTATLSRSADGGTWLTIGGVSRPAQFDGQVVVSQQSAPRRFVECACGDRSRVDETLRIALLSSSQDQALGSECPPNPLDGGLPPPDGGVLPPGPTDGGSFDAIRACGELIDVVVPDPAADPPCQCAQCTMVYSVSGLRR